MGEDHEQTKRLLRRELQEARRRLRGSAQAMSSAACLRLAGLAEFFGARHVVLYAPIDGEVDPGGVAAAAADRAVYYPRTDGGRLEVLEAEASALVPGRFGIPEPTSGAPLREGTRDAVFVVPGLAFDLEGVRLGRGGGWYDRVLARYPEAVRVGLAYEFQVLPRLPAASWDVRMDALVTEARVLAVRDRRAASLKETRP